MDFEEVIGNNRVEDVSWLCTLSESELVSENMPEEDLLISLKELTIQRAKIIGYDELAKKFNLKILRALGFILIEYLKARMKDLSDIPSLADSTDLFNNSNLLNCNLDNNISMEELNACIRISSRKRKAGTGSRE